MRKSLVTLLPLLVFVLLTLLFADRLAAPRVNGAIDSPLIGKPMPELPFANWPKDIKPPYIVNVFASWCAPCVIEHPNLIALQKTGITIIGIAYKDTQANIKKYLKAGGNPYKAVLYDDKGEAAILLGITGVPESFAVDAQGLVRARQQGPFADADTINDFVREMRK